MAELDDLLTEIRNPASSIREEMFQYLHQQHVLPQIPEGQARMFFGDTIDDPLATACVRSYATTYLPVHLQRQKARAATQPVATGPLSPAQQTYLFGALKKAGFVGAMGLTAIVLSTSMDPGGARKAMQWMGSLAFIGAGVGAVLAYLGASMKPR